MDGTRDTYHTTISASDHQAPTGVETSGSPNEGKVWEDDSDPPIDYAHWAKRSVLTLWEAVRLLYGYGAHRRPPGVLEDPGLPPPDARLRAEDLARSAIKAGDLPVVSADTELVRPHEFARWAVRQGLPVPDQLNEAIRIVRSEIKQRREKPRARAPRRHALHEVMYEVLSILRQKLGKKPSSKDVLKVLEERATNGGGTVQEVDWEDRRVYWRSFSGLERRTSFKRIENYLSELRNDMSRVQAL